MKKYPLLQSTYRWGARKKNVVVSLISLFLMTGCFMDTKVNGNYKSVEHVMDILTFEKIALGNIGAQFVKSNLNLPKEIEGCSVLWTAEGLTTESSIDINTGKIKRGNKDCLIKLNADVESKDTGKKNRKTIEVRILNKDYEMNTNMVLITAGSYLRSSSEKITFTYGFYMSKFETTYEDFDCYTKDRKIPFKEDLWGRGKMPVVNVTWWESVKYCNWMSELAGLPKAYNEITGEMLDAEGSVTLDITKVKGYRLPTEAEWECGAKGGKQFIYSGVNLEEELTKVAWYFSNSGDKTHEVGKKNENKDLCDMTGNVWEWCSDWLDTDYLGTYVNKTNPANIGVNSGNISRIIKGGGFKIPSILYEPAYAGMRYDSYKIITRGGTLPEKCGNDMGFRIARSE